MKVILQAFGGKLKSDPIEFPDEIGPTIHLMMDIDNMSYKHEHRYLTTDSFTHKRGKFDYTMSSIQLPDKQFARVYRLVEIS